MSMLEPEGFRCSCKACSNSFARADRLSGTSGLAGLWERRKLATDVFKGMMENPAVFASFVAASSSVAMQTGIAPTPELVNRTSSEAREAVEFVRENAEAIEQTNQAVQNLEPRVAGAENALKIVDQNTGILSGKLDQTAKQVDDGAKQLEATRGNLSTVSDTLDEAERVIEAQGGGLSEARTAITSARTALAATVEVLDVTSKAVGETQGLLGATRTALDTTATKVESQAGATEELAAALTQAKATVAEAIASGGAAKAAADLAGEAATSALQSASTAQGTAQVAQQAVDAVNGTLAIVDVTLAAAQATLVALDVQIRDAATAQAVALSAATRAIGQVFAASFSLNQFPALLEGVDAFDPTADPWDADGVLSVPGAGFPYATVDPDVVWAGAWKPRTQTAALLEGCAYGPATVRARVSASVAGEGGVRLLLVDPTSNAVLAEAETTSGTQTLEVTVRTPVDGLPLLGVVAYGEGRSASVRLLGGSMHITAPLVC